MNSIPPADDSPALASLIRNNVPTINNPGKRSPSNSGIKAVFTLAVIARSE